MYRMYTGGGGFLEVANGDSENDSDVVKITANPQLNQYIGDDQFFWVELYTGTYDNHALRDSLYPFSVTVRPCEIESVSLTADPNQIDYTLFGDRQVIKITNITTPECDYNYDISISIHPPLTSEKTAFHTYDAASYEFSIYTESVENAGTYFFTAQYTIASYTNRETGDVILFDEALEVF